MLAISNWYISISSLSFFSKGDLGIRINPECSGRPRRKSHKDGWVGRGLPLFKCSLRERRHCRRGINWGVLPIAVSPWMGLLSISAWTEQGPNRCYETCCRLFHTKPSSFSHFPSFRKQVFYVKTTFKLIINDILLLRFPFFFYCWIMFSWRNKRTNDQNLRNHFSWVLI